MCISIILVAKTILFHWHVVKITQVAVYVFRK